MSKLLRKAQRAQRTIVQSADAIRTEGDGTVRHSYADYESYRTIQIAGNKAKLDRQFVKESHIAALSDWLARHYDGTISFGLCHGTRRGREQAWFRDHLPAAPEVIGTDISDTAGLFPHSVQWDFHDHNPDWAGRADFVYSNSWDHAHDPERAFAAWSRSLKAGGLLLLDHTKDHDPNAANALDPFGATIEALQAILSDALAEKGRIRGVIDRSGAADYPARVVVWQRTPTPDG